MLVKAQAALASRTVLAFIRPSIDFTCSFLLSANGEEELGMKGWGDLGLDHSLTPPFLQLPAYMYFEIWKKMQTQLMVGVVITELLKVNATIDDMC